MSTEISTILCASNVPIDIILINWCKSNIRANKAAINPESSIAFNGVFARSFTLFNASYKIPSEDIAYIIRGKGKSAPNKLVNNAKTTPIETIYFIRNHLLINMR